jgi:hypothetical protein
MGIREVQTLELRKLRREEFEEGLSFCGPDCKTLQLCEVHAFQHLIAMLGAKVVDLCSNLEFFKRWEPVAEFKRKPDLVR